MSFYAEDLCVSGIFARKGRAIRNTTPPITALFVNFVQIKLSHWSNYDGGEETKRGDNLLLIGQENLNVQNK